MRSTDLVGQSLGHYQITALLAEDELAAVFEAFDTVLQTQVALNLFSQPVANLQGLAGLQHPHIVPIYEVGSLAEYGFIAMQLVAGPSLETELLKHDLYTPQATVALLQPIASALDVAHRYGLIHGAINPRSVVFDQAAIPLLCDFGRTRTFADSAAVALLEHADYLAPEQLDSQAALTPAVDVYALGLLAFRMLTGSRPFQGSVADVVAAHLATMPPRASSINPVLPAAVDAVLARAMAKAPDDRFPTADGFITALASAVTAMQPAASKLDRSKSDPTHAKQPAALSTSEIEQLRAQAAARRNSSLWPFFMGLGVFVAIIVCIAIRAVLGARDQGFALQTVEAATAQVRQATDTANMTAQALVFNPTPTSQLTVCSGPLQGRFAQAWNDHPELQTLGCPSIGEREGPGSIQYFTGGSMVYWQATIFVFYGSDSGSWQTFAEPVTDSEPQESAPPGLYAPVGGFGTIWRTNPAVRELLGWATTPEYPITAVYQPFPAGQMIYSPAIDSLPARIWALQTIGTWISY